MVINIDLLKLKEYTDEQIRAIITTYCIYNDILVDTENWEELIFTIYEYYYCNSTLKTLEEFDSYMSELLV